MSIQQIKRWFELARPNPTSKECSVQIGCMLEEVAELLGAVGDIENAEFVSAMGDYYKINDELGSLGRDERIEVADAVADIIVTAVGVGHMYNIDVIGAVGEVNRSNYTKFVDGKPVFNEHGKIAKGPNYRAPELGDFVGWAE